MFTVLAVVDSSHDDGSLYPIKDHDNTSLIKLEPLDGPNCERVAVSRLVVHQSIGGKFKEVVRLGDIKAEMIISDARVAVACMNYNRAGGVGLGLVAAAAINTARKAHTHTAEIRRYSLARCAIHGYGRLVATPGADLDLDMARSTSA